MKNIFPVTPVMLFLKECQGCGGVEERLFVDSWTGIELCTMCLSEVLDEVTMSPASEGDNFKDVLKKHELMEEDEDDD